MDDENEKDVEEATEDGAAEGDESAEVGPPDDIENDPAYDPDDPELKGIKGG